MSDHERGFYQRLVRARFAQNRMLLAENHGRADLFEPEYAKLRALGAATRLHAVKFALIRTPLRSLVRLQHRSRSLLLRGLRIIKQHS